MESFMILRRLKVEVVFLTATCAWGVWLFSGTALKAQTTTGSVVGAVTAATGGSIPSAAVSVTNIETSNPRTTETDGNGAYQFLILPPGYY
jgi:hypothetical protein